MLGPGNVFEGKYSIERVIGRGGSAVVLSAFHATLKCRVALKLLRRDIPLDDEASFRLVREGQIGAQIQSEHVARVLDAGTLPDRQPFLVLEYLEGQHLGAILAEERRLPMPRAVDYVRQACTGVSAAHARGIIHRDLKPSNLFLATRADGFPLVKIVDFGIAKMSGAGGVETITSCDRMVGSPQFMAPEQLRSERTLGPRSDIWALGAVLFTLLTGRPPFKRRDINETCEAILSGVVPDLMAVRPELPRPLAKVVQRCMAADPRDRFESAEALCDALRPFTDLEARAWLNWLERVWATDRDPSFVEIQASDAPPSSCTTTSRLSKTG